MVKMKFPFEMVSFLGTFVHFRGGSLVGFCSAIPKVMRRIFFESKLETWIESLVINGV